MCHDLAGYMPARDPVSNNEAKVFIRGTQMACFSANMQTHGKVTRPYDFPPEVVDVYRFYSDVHYVLVPYLVEQARVSCETGVPLVRHLYLEFPGDRRTWEIEDQYFLGNGLLVAPVLYDADKRNVYLPAGRWEGLWDGQTFEGPCELTAYPAPLEQIPVFVFDGSESAVLPELVKEIRIRYQAWKKGRRHTITTAALKSFLPECGGRYAKRQIDRAKKSADRQRRQSTEEQVVQDCWVHDVHVGKLVSAGCKLTQ